MDRKIELTDEQIEKARRILDPYCCIGGQTTDMAFILRLAAVLSESVTLTDDKCCIGPPDKDGRKCTADWLETDESDELHVIEYRLHRPAVPAPAQEPVAPMDDKCPKCGYTTRITMNSDYSPLRARLTEQPTNNSERESSLRDRVGAILARHGIISYPERPSVIAEIVAELEKEPRHAS